MNISLFLKSPNLPSFSFLKIKKDVTPEYQETEVIEDAVREVEIDNSPILSLFKIDNEFGLCEKFITDFKKDEGLSLLSILTFDSKS